MASWGDADQHHSPRHCAHSGCIGGAIAIRGGAATTCAPTTASSAVKGFGCIAGTAASADLCPGAATGKAGATRGGFIELAFVVMGCRLLARWRYLGLYVATGLEVVADQLGDGRGSGGRLGGSRVDGRRMDGRRMGLGRGRCCRSYSAFGASCTLCNTTGAGAGRAAGHISLPNP